MGPDHASAFRIAGIARSDAKITKHSFFCQDFKKTSEILNKYEGVDKIASGIRSIK